MLKTKCIFKRHISQCSRSWQVADIRAISIEDFSKRLGFRMDRPVVDQTNVGGLFDFHLEFAPDMSTPSFSADPSDPTAGQSIFTAVQTHLGLRLEAAKGR